MGNTVVWKPATTALLAAKVIMEIFEAAGMPPGVINMIAGTGRRGVRGGGQASRARRHPLHRIHRDVPASLDDRRRQPWPVPDIPTARRRDRRQELRPRASLCVGGGAPGRPAPRLVRVPGTEVLCSVAGVHPAVDVGAAARAAGRGDRRDPGRRPRGVQHLHGRGDRRAELPQARSGPDRGSQRSGPRADRRRRMRLRSRLVRAPDDLLEPEPAARSLQARTLRTRSSRCSRTPTASGTR